MALVAYDYDSDSENEEEDTNSSKVILNEAHKDHIYSRESAESSQKVDSSVQGASLESQLFGNLPKSRTVGKSIIEENDKLEDFIPTVKTLKEKKKVQISIPSLNEFDKLGNEDEPLRKRTKPSQKSSGLLGILPPVQSTPLSNISFIPNTVKSKNVPSKTVPTSQGMMPYSVRKNMEVKKALVKVKSKKGSDSETDDEDVPVPDTFDDEMWEKICGRPKAPVVETDETENIKSEQFTIAPEPEKPYDGLDNKAFKELVGKTKRPIGNIKLIDINEDEILSDKDTWMMKSLTDPEMAPKTQVEDPVDPTRKRKHHITYLAQQAKANEQELKTAWAASKNNRMMSRSKYGF